MWDLPGAGLELASPALAGGFLTTVPPGKSFPFCFDNIRLHFFGDLALPTPSGPGEAVSHGAPSLS